MKEKWTYYLTSEQAKRLERLAQDKDYIVLRGQHIGKGSVSKLLQALADGELTAIKIRG